MQFFLNIKKNKSKKLSEISKKKKKKIKQKYYTTLTKI